MTGLLAITLDQPWAWLVVNGHCDIINRFGPTEHRGLIAVHAGRRHDALAHIDPDVVEAVGGVQRIFWTDRVVGVVEITGVSRSSESRWHVPGMIAWSIANSQTLTDPVEVGTGYERGLWELPAAAATEVLAQCASK